MKENKFAEKTVSRREFIKGASAAGASFLILPSGLYSTVGAAANSPNNRLNVAIVGVGGRGRSALRFMASENVVAFCDVDLAKIDESLEDLLEEDEPEAYPERQKLLDREGEIPRYQDFRRMFDDLEKQIDAVVISTPDHMHFPIAMWAMKLGKHVYVEKPLTRTIWEARELTRAARKYGVVTQMGNQGHSEEGTRIIREWIDAGVIGDVREVHHWTNRPIWPQGIDAPDHSEFIPVVPQSMDWDLWLGVAPERPYDPAYAPFKWRAWWDFGCGALGDMGCHIMDAAFWSLDLGHPTTVEAVSTEFNDHAAPEASVVTYQFPARGKMPPVKVTWQDGGLKPMLPPEVSPDYEIEDNGTLIIGERATIRTGTYGGSPRLVPETKMKELRPLFPKKTIPRVKGGPRQEWVDACKGGPACGSNFDYAGPFTETVLLGNVAIRARRKIEWDGPNLKITNVAEANQFVGSTYQYRKGWGV